MATINASSAILDLIDFIAEFMDNMQQFREPGHGDRRDSPGRLKSWRSQSARSILLSNLNGDSRSSAMVRVVMMRSMALGMTVLTGLLTAAFLGPAGRGEQAAMIVAPQFLAGLSSLGLHAALIYNMRTDPEREWEYLGANLVMTTVAATIMAVAGWLAIPWWLAGFDARVVHTARWLLCITPMLAMSWCFMAAAEVKGRFGFANFVANIQSLLTLSLLLLFVWSHRLTPQSSACIYILSNIPVFFALAWRVLSLGRPVIVLRRAITGKLLHYGLRFYGTDLLGTISGYLDQIVIVPLLPPAAIGIYVVARSLALTLSALSDAVSSVLFPSIAGQPVAVAVGVVFKTLRVTGAFNIGLALLLGLAAPALLHLLYGQRFIAAATPLRILLFAGLFLNSTRVLYQIYNATGRPELVTMIEAIGTAIGLGLMLLLVPAGGVVGAAIAVLIAGVVRLTCTIAIMSRLLSPHLPLSRFLFGQPLEP